MSENISDECRGTTGKIFINLKEINLKDGQDLGTVFMN